MLLQKAFSLVSCIQVLRVLKNGDVEEVVYCFAAGW